LYSSQPDIPADFFYTLYMKPLELPVNIRVPRMDEVSSDPIMMMRMKARESAKIVEGYAFRGNDIDEGEPYTIFSEINIDNSRLWALFERLAEVVCYPRMKLLYKNIDDENQSNTEYVETKEIIAKLAKYKTELTQDGFLEFGLFHKDENVLIVLYVKKGKFIQHWGMDAALFESVMREFSLEHIPDLNYVDQYPLMTESLKQYNPDVLETSEVIEYLKSSF
jgi:hypothetical protein